jgi:hypothetical protein
MSFQLCNKMRTGDWLAFDPVTLEPSFGGCTGPEPWFHLDLVYGFSYSGMFAI